MEQKVNLLMHILQSSNGPNAAGNNMGGHLARGGMPGQVGAPSRDAKPLDTPGLRYKLPPYARLRARLCTCASSPTL